MRSGLLVTFSLVCVACSDRTVVSDDEANSTTTNGDGDGDMSTETSTSGDGDGDGDPLADPCGCEDGELCVGDCVWGDFNPDSVQNRRCIDATLCNENGWDSLECMEHACYVPWAERQSYCGPPDESEGYDIICGEGIGPASCDETAQDCPEDEKCVLQSLDRFDNVTRCVLVVGTDAIGEPCSSQGADPDGEGTDSCVATAMCWNGTLTNEPFEGVCQPFCSPLDPQCPEQMGCELAFGPFQLCLPSP